MNKEVTDVWLEGIPKVDLHVHLDGSLRPKLLWDILEREGINPFSSSAELEKRVRVPDEVANLSAYLGCFEFILQHLQDPADIERAAYELAEDSAAENIRYLEVRFSPILHLERGASIEDIIEAALGGLKRAEMDFPITTGLIVSCIREKPPELSVRLARAARKYLDRGVVGFDLAGDEFNYPGRLHQEAFDLAAEAGLRITVHAGEARGAASIREALGLLHARRIGHGLHLKDDPALLREVREKGIPLEICLTTNVHTKAAKSFAEHPFVFYLREGIKATLNTDDRLMSNTTLTREFLRARDHLGLDRADFIQLTENALEAAFLEEEAKEKLKAKFTRELERC